jgi:hypothetical protein
MADGDGQPQGPVRELRRGKGKVDIVVQEARGHGDCVGRSLVPCRPNLEASTTIGPRRRISQVVDTNDLRHSCSPVARTVRNPSAGPSILPYSILTKEKPVFSLLVIG